MRDHLKDFDFRNFWEDCEYSKKEYEGSKVYDLHIQRVQEKLKYKLPASYINLVKNKNGGLPLRTNHGMRERTSWAEDHIAITGIFGIDADKPNSLLGNLGTQFWIDQWNYPDIGLYICDCPSAGHDMVCLDYSLCGSQGEPRVVHVDQERNFKITLIAETFEDFIRGLEGDEAF